MTNHSWPWRVHADDVSNTHVWYGQMKPGDYVVDDRDGEVCLVLWNISNPHDERERNVGLLTLNGCDFRPDSGPGTFYDIDVPRYLSPKFGKSPWHLLVCARGRQ